MGPRPRRGRPDWPQHREKAEHQDRDQGESQEQEGGGPSFLKSRPGGNEPGTPQKHEEHRSDNGKIDALSQGSVSSTAKWGIIEEEAGLGSHPPSHSTSGTRLRLRPLVPHRGGDTVQPDDHVENPIDG